MGTDRPPGRGLGVPLSRALITAKACADVADLPLQIDERLRELDFGAGEGLTSAEMGDRFPDALEAFRADPVAHHLPDGEDPVKAADRFTACLHDLAQQHPDGRVLVVAHTTAIRLALCRLIGVPLSEYRRLFPFVRNCGLTELRLTGTAAIQGLALQQLAGARREFNRRCVFGIVAPCC